MIFDYLEPLKLEEVRPKYGTWMSNQLGSLVTMEYQGNLEEGEFRLAILGVGEDRSSTSNHGCGTGMNKIRQELYGL